MKTFPLHPASFAAGLAIAGAFVFLTSQTSAPTFPTQRVEVGPHPRDMVQIVGGAPYTVPPGRGFVLTALGCLNPNYSTELRVNGQLEVVASVPVNGDVWIHDTPKGLTAPWGSVIDLQAGSATGQARAWGYLAER